MCVEKNLKKKREKIERGKKKSTVCQFTKVFFLRVTHLHHGNVVFVDSVLVHALPNLAGRLDSLFAHDGLLHSGEILEGREEAVHVFRPTNLGDQVPHLLSHGEQALILVVVAVGEERDELSSSALRPERRGDRGEALYGVETQLNVFVL